MAANPHVPNASNAPAPPAGPLSSITSKLAIRPWTSFAGYGEQNPYNATVSPTKIIGNLKHFQANYLMLSFAFIAIDLITQPVPFVVVVALILVGIGVFRAPDSLGIPTPFEFVITKKHITIVYALGVIGSCFYLITCLTWWMIFLGFVTCLGHSMFRRTPVDGQGGSNDPSSIHPTGNPMHGNNIKENDDILEAEATL